MEIATHKWKLPALLAQRASETPDRPFLREVDGATESFAVTMDRAARWGGAVRAIGVGPNEPVVTMLEHPRTCVHSWLGINAARAWEVPIHTEYRGRYLAHVLNTTRARVAIVAERFVERFTQIARELPSLERLVVVGDPRPADGATWSTASLDDLLGAAVPLDESDQLGHGDVSCVLFTSGTTGVSKAVLVPYAHLRGTVEGAWPPGDLGPDDRYYSMLPLYHMAAKVAVGAALQAGAQLVLRERFSTEAFWSDVRATGSTCTVLMGSMPAFLLSTAPSPDDRDHPLDKTLLIPLPSQLDAFRERFGVRARTLYNQTETSTPIQSDGYDTPDYRVVGRPRPGVECRIVDEHDEPVPHGEIGELIVRCDEPWSMMAGYLGMPDKTVGAWRNLWLHTGDAFRMDEKGNYCFVDRLKDAIRRRGENISSFELEASVCEHPAVAECAAVGVRSELGEEEVKVVVVAAGGARLDPLELVGFLAERIPRFMVPRFVEIVDELPRTPTAKVRKAELREAGITEATWDRERVRPSRTRRPASGERVA